MTQQEKALREAQFKSGRLQTDVNALKNALLELGVSQVMIADFNEACRAVTLAYLEEDKAESAYEHSLALKDSLDYPPCQPISPRVL